MLDLSYPILVYSGSVDMRKSINGLCILIRLSNHTFDRGNAFIFFNKNLDKVKILTKEDNGFVLLYKRLDAGRFKISLSSKTGVSLTSQQLRYLLDGLDYVTLTRSKTTVPTHFF